MGDKELEKRNLIGSLNDKAMDERVARFIQNQSEFSVVEEVNDYKDQIFAELKAVQDKRFTELEQHFREDGQAQHVPPYEGQIYPGVGDRGYYPFYGQNDFYANDPYYKAKRGDRYYGNGYGYGYPYGYNPYTHVEPYQGKDSNTKYLDEHPQQDWE